MLRNAPKSISHAVILWLVTVAASSFVQPAAAVNWVGGTGFWSNGLNWSGGATPGFLGSANIAPTDGSPRTITLDVSTPLLNNMYLDLTGPGVARTTFQMSANSLNTYAGVVVGYNGRATFNQSGGSVLSQATDWDTVVGYQPGANGIYNLSGTGSLSVGRGLYVGTYGTSSGTFNQSGGTVGTQMLVVGSVAGSTGTYALSAGALSVSNEMYVAHLGTATVTQTGGTNAIDSELFVGVATGSSGTYSLSSGDLSTQGDQTVGYGGTGDFDQTGGTNYIGANLVIGHDASSVGTYTLSGGTLTNEGNLTVGNFGNGTLEISNGTTVSGILSEVGYQAMSQGLVRVNGSGSSFDSTLRLDIGNGGDGTVVVQNGGNLFSDTELLLGRFAGSSGTLLVTGTGSTATTNGNLRLGDEGAGLLRIENGGVVNSPSGFLARNAATGTATVYADGAGSTWNIGGNLSIGRAGVGSLQIRNGGVVSVNSGTGTVTMTTLADSQGQIRIGDGGVGPAGTLLASSVSGGAGVANMVFDHAESDYSFAPQLTGTLSVYHYNSGTTKLTAANTYTGTTNILGGRLLVNGTHTGGGAYTVGPLGTLGGTGTINSPVTVQGTLAPGNSPGTITINGNYTQTSTGALEIEVGGLNASANEHDLLVVTGTASLNGRLEVPIVNGFVPQPNDLITFLDAGVLTGQFSAVVSPNLASVNPDVAIQVIYDYDNDLAKLKFVMPETDIEFDGDDPIVGWQDPNTWTTGMVPNSTNIITVQNLVSGGQRVEVAGANASVHELTVTSNTDPITVAVDPGLSLSATTSVTVGKQGVIELGAPFNPVGGQLASSTTLVDNGGLLAGNGTVAGNLIVGGGNGPESILRPGFSVGHVEVIGDYQQGTNGTLAVETGIIAAPGQVDTVNVEGEAQLGGTLSVDISQLLVAVPGSTTFEIVRADSLIGTFDNVETVGSDEFYVRAIYDYEADGGGGTASGGICDLGDMNCDGQLNGDDTHAFAVALRDLDRYYEDYLTFTSAGGDLDGWADGQFHPNGRIDFDDINDFAALIAGSGSGANYAGIVATIYAQMNAPEPSSGLLCLVGAGMMAAGFRRRAGGAKRPKFVVRHAI